MRVAVTGAGGRLGRALVAALQDAPFTGLSGPIPWDRAAFDLDAPESIHALLDRDRPEAVDPCGCLDRRRRLRPRARDRPSP